MTKSQVDQIGQSRDDQQRVTPKHPEWQTAFLHGASQLGLTTRQLEHDAWLIYALGIISRQLLDETFRHPYTNKPVGRLVFAGGTSLSAAWKVVPRWSQDIDLLLDPVAGVKSRQLRTSMRSLGIKVSQEAGGSMVLSSRSRHHHFFEIVGLPNGISLSIDITYCALAPPIWVEPRRVTPLAAKVKDSRNATTELQISHFTFPSLGPGYTAMNKLLAQTHLSQIADLDQISERARDVYDLAYIARSADQFEGHIGRDTPNLLYLAQQNRRAADGATRPDEGFKSIASFALGTPQYTALKEGYQLVLDNMAFGEKLSLQEAIDLALTLDPGPPKRPASLDSSSEVIYPSHLTLKSE